MHVVVAAAVCVLDVLARCAKQIFSHLAFFPMVQEEA